MILKRLKISISIGLFLAFNFSSCGRKSQNEYQPQVIDRNISAEMKTFLKTKNSESIIPPGISDKLLLGSGYDSKTQEYAAQCIEGDIRHVGQHSMETNIYHNIDMHSLINELSGNANNKVQYSAFKEITLADYVGEITNDDYSSTFTNITTYKAKQITLTNLKTSKIGGSTINPNNTIKNSVTQICGDEFINAVNLGSKLIYTIKFAFENELQKNNFEEVTNFESINIGNILKKLETDKDKFSENINLQISVRQFGGDYDKIREVIEASDLNCDLNNVKKCIDTINKLENYKANEYSDQLRKIELNPETEKGFAVINWQTAQYANHLVAHNNTAIRFIPKNDLPKYDFELEQLKKDLLYKYEEEVTNLNRVSSLLFNFKINNEYIKEQLSNILLKSTENKNLLRRAADTCFSEPSNCKFATEEVYANLNIYNSGVLHSNIMNILPKNILSGLWTSWNPASINMFQISQTGSRIAMGVYDYRGELTFYSYNGSFIDEETAFLPITVIKRKQDNTYCSLNATAKLSIIDDENFNLRIKYSSEDDYKKCFETDKFQICTKGDSYNCLEKTLFTRVPF
ncbi:hypothetical protein [Fluviispira vulneris]|uniref:hypothetical protein n=1 Tax=Fluviispira vulneris TaxID=2763012 RepID=UPI00164649FF|nr:hypothetical protein [Fluviispira vulneris]